MSKPWTPEQREKVLKAFMVDGRIIAFPRKPSRKEILLDVIAQLFEPGARYTELEVNALLRAVTDDYVTARRYLIDFGFLSREEGVYWRTGGSVSPRFDE
jgi:hypothetical protein